MRTLLSCAFSLALTALPASAAVVDVTITGTLGGPGLFSAYDTYSNVWNGALVQGAAFTARFVYDTSIGRHGNSVNLQPGDILSGSDADPAGNPTTASLMIGTSTVVFESPSGLADDRDSSTVFVAPGYFPSPDFGYDWARYGVSVENYDDSFDYSFGGQLYFDINAVLGTLPSNLETDYNLAFSPDDIFPPFALPIMTGFASLSDFRRSTGERTIQSFVQLYGTSIDVKVRGGDVDPPAPVPLPAGFPMLAAAVGGLAALRRRRRTA